VYLIFSSVVAPRSGMFNSYEDDGGRQTADDLITSAGGPVQLYADLGDAPPELDARCRAACRQLTVWPLCYALSAAGKGIIAGHGRFAITLSSEGGDTGCGNPGRHPLIFRFSQGSDERCQTFNAPRLAPSRDEEPPPRQPESKGFRSMRFVVPLFNCSHAIIARLRPPVNSWAAAAE
jgi:hypothetical protein